MEFSGNSVADLSVECLDVFNVFLPAFNVNGEEVADGVDGYIVETFDVDVFCLRNVADGGEPKCILSKTLPTSCETF